MISSKTLKECLEAYSYDILLELMRLKGIPEQRNLSRKELCGKIAEYMMQKAEMERYFLCLFDHEMEQLERNLSKDFEVGTREGSYEVPELLCQSEYAFRFMDDTYDIERFWLPYDVAEAFWNMRSEHFTEKRKKQNHFLSCLMAVGTFYGQVPLDVIMPIMKMDVGEIVIRLLNLPREINHYLVDGDYLYQCDLVNDDYGLSSEQKDVPYYIPSEDELAELGRWGYLPSRMEMRTLVNYLVNEQKMEKESAEYAAMWVQKFVAADACMGDIYEYLWKFGALKYGGIPQELIELLKEFERNTRKLVYRGHTKTEISWEDKTKEEP